MSVERRLLDILDASTAPELVGVPMTYGYAAQDDEKVPTALPLLVLQRVGSEWLTDICGTRALPCIATVVVVHIARGLEQARAQAQAARLELITCAEQPRLDSETEEYDPDLRGWLVTQSWTVFDDDPDVINP